MTDSPGGDAPLDECSDPVDCDEALDRLFDFLDEEIAEIDGDRIRQHLADCEPCLGEYEISECLKKLVRRSCHDVAPDGLHVRIREQLTVLRMQLRPRE